MAHFFDPPPLIGPPLKNGKRWFILHPGPTVLCAWSPDVCPCWGEMVRKMDKLPPIGIQLPRLVGKNKPELASGRRAVAPTFLLGAAVAKTTRTGHAVSALV